MLSARAAGRAAPALAFALDYTAYPSAAALGLLHGSDPSHGWPLAVAYGASRGSLAAAIAAALVLAACHLASAVAVVAAVWVLGGFWEGLSRALAAAAGAALVVLGARALAAPQRGEGRGAPARPDLRGLARYGLALGFAHEEDVALAAIVLAGADPLILSAAYSASVAGSMAALSAAGWLAAASAPGGLREALARALDRATGALLVLIGASVLAEVLAGG